MMHKTNLLTFSALLFFSFSFCQQKDTIYGKVKSVREQLEFLDNNRQNKKMHPDEGEYGHYGFSNARFTKKIFYDWWYNTPWVHNSNYFKMFNKKGVPTHEVWFYKDGDTLANYKYTYDKNDNLIQEKNIIWEDEYNCKNYTYDYKNKVISTMYYDSDDPNLYSYTAYIRDSLSNLIETKRFDEFGEIGSLKYFYDTNGNLLETHYYHYDPSDNLPSKLSSIVKNIYNNGLLEKSVNIRDTINSFTEYKYDEQNRKKKKIITSIRYPDDNRSNEYFYDKDGNIIKLIYTEKNKSTVVEFRYKFDNQNNWTEQIKSVNGEKLFVWTRNIEYYE